MPRPFKRPYSKPIPPDGEIFTKKGKQFCRFKGSDGRIAVAPLTKSGKGIRLYYQDYYAKVRNADGKVELVRLCSNREAADQLLRELVNKVQFERAGIRDRFDDHRKRPLTEHLQAYQRHLEAKGNTLEHVKLTVNRIRATLAGCHCKFTDELSASTISEWLADARKNVELDGLGVTGLAKSYAAVARAFGVCVSTIYSWRGRGAPLQPPGPYDLAAIVEWRRQRNCGVSVETTNHYVRAMKGFARWLVRDRRMQDNPLAHLSILNARPHRRRERRALTDAELGRLLEAARNGSPFRELSGDDREALYLVAAFTGLRASELASLTRASFDMDSEPPTVTVEAAYSKHRRQDVLPLHPDVVGKLRKWWSTKRPEDRQMIPIGTKASGPSGSKTTAPAARMWPGMWFKKAAPMLRRDLQSAGIPFLDEQGHCFDFHALRHQFITSLARSKVHPKVAQELARHSDIKLTMQTYTHLGLLDMTTAVESLPGIQQPRRDALQATGTEDEPASERGRQCAPQCAQESDFDCDSMTTADDRKARTIEGAVSRNPLKIPVLDSVCDSLIIDGLLPEGVAQLVEQRTFNP